jgi:hypothetical protein
MSGARTTHCVSLVLLALALAVPTMRPLPAQAEPWDSIPPNPNVTIAYIPPDSPDLKATYQALKDRRVLEEYQRFLAPLRLPHRLLLLARQCNQNNAFYSPDNRSLTLCYELVQFDVEHAPKTVSADGFITRQAAIIGDVVGTLLHESGHMMFDMLKVPVFGREEDAADETASFIALQFSPDVARTIVKGWANTWAQEKDPNATAQMSTWSDVHGKASQRLYNTLCLGYGGDPKLFQEFVDRGWLPKNRAEQCGQEFALLKLAFVKTIYPFIDRDLMVRVQQTQWLTPDELK